MGKNSEKKNRFDFYENIIYLITLIYKTFYSFLTLPSQLGL